MSKRIALALCALSVGAAPALSAQQPGGGPSGGQDPQLLDRIVAVVGDSMILQTQVDQQVLELARAGQRIPDDAAGLRGLRRQIIEGMVDELLLVQAAVRDSIVVPAEELSQLVEREITRVQERVGGRPALEQVLEEEGLTMATYRAALTEQLRKQQTIGRYLGKVRQERPLPPVTEAELRQLFESEAERFANRPETLTFEQVVVRPAASDSARAAALERMEEVAAALRAGESFEELARRYSEDPGSRQQGGDLGWFRRGQMVQEFEDAVYALRPGQVSGIVETPFGLHIIKLEKVRGAERQARHILIRPDMSEGDASRARSIAERVAIEMDAGTPIDTLVRRHGDPSEEKRIGPYPIAQLPGPYAAALSNAAAGDVVGPIRLDEELGVRWAVVKVLDRTAAGRYSLEEARPHLRAQLQEQKLLEELVGELRRRSYIDIRI